MKKSILLVALFTAGVCLAESSVVADIKEKNRLHKFDPSIPFSERNQKIIAIENRVRPIVNEEFAKLADGDITPLVRELLHEPETEGFCNAELYKLLKTASPDMQTNILQKVFAVAPDSFRGRILRSLVFPEFPKEIVAGDDIQKWLVAKINAGLPAGPFYFFLTNESSEAVTKAATANMRRFVKEDGHSGRNQFSLLSASFLASRGDKAALKLLNTLVDERDIDSILDIAYVLQAAAMSGNEKLIYKIRDIITTDTRTHWNGEDALPQETSFAHVAASVCALTIEGFPEVRYWGDYNNETKTRVHDWLKANPAHTIKPDAARMFFRESPFQSVIPDMARAGWCE